MKKFIFILMMSIMTFTVSAQELVQTKLLDNTFIGVNAGFGPWLRSQRHLNNTGNGLSFPIVGVHAGKYFTPSVGFEVAYDLGIKPRGDFGNASFVSANLLVNLSNAIGGYKCEPYTFDFVPFVGTGWYHTHDITTNNIAARAGMQINTNFGSDNQWQINIIPSINYVLTDNGFSTEMTNQPRFDIRRSWINIQMGLTYKFKTSNGTHNFKCSDKVYTQAYMDAQVENYNELNGKVNTLREKVQKMYNDNRLLADKVTNLSDQNTKLVEENNALKNKTVTYTSTIGFNIGQYAILDTNLPTIYTIVKMMKSDENATLVLEGYADADTGSKERNMELSEQRVNAVKEDLVARGVDANRIKTVAKGDTVQLFKENDANRVVISLLTK